MASKKPTVTYEGLTKDENKARMDFGWAVRDVPLKEVKRIVDSIRTSKYPSPNLAAWEEALEELKWAEACRPHDKEKCDLSSPGG